MHLKVFISTLLLLFSFLAFGQKAQKKYSEADSVEVNRLLQLSKNNFSEAPDKAISLAEQARILADSIRYFDGVAVALKNIGIAYYYQGKNVEALDYWKQSFEIYKSIGDQVGEANILNNIGAIYFNQGDDANALEYYLQSLALAEKTGDKLRILTAYNNIGGVYFNKPATHDKALFYFLKALPLSEEMGDKEALGTTTVNLGEIYYAKNNDSLALFYYNISEKAYNNSENSPYVYNAIGKVYNRQGEYSLAITYHKRALAIADKLNGNLDIVQSLMGLGVSYFLYGDLSKGFDYLKQAEKLALEFQFTKELKDIYKELASSYNQVKDYKNAYSYHTRFSNIKDTLYNIETDKKLGSLQFDFEIQKKQGEINLLTKDKALQDADLKRQKLAKNAFLIGALLILFITFNLYRNYLAKVKTNKLLDKQKDEIEGLLLNTLPAEIAKELQTTGKAEPRHYDHVSVLFSDFVDFTSHSENMTAQELVEHLNTCIMAFDDIMGKYNLEKIKTIGDAYMCAGGIPIEDDNHTFRIVKAGHEMHQWIEKDNKERIQNGLKPWGLRIGIHVGPLVAGVVGKKKYAYDIWGSTVNIASRMESNGAAGKVNVSKAVYDLIEDRFECEQRGKIYAKNVGDIEMYFVGNEFV
jgi:class 3 adenylate cyclase/Flp pilus assembly protein TadD